MELTSRAFLGGGYIPKTFTCEGEDVHPPLSISRVPAGAQSLALIVSDPDAPSGDFTHWLMWNIPPDTAKIEHGVLPQDAFEGKNDFGSLGWRGPCPPSGTHRYFFLLYALDTLLDLPETSTKTDLLGHINGFILEEALLMGLYTKEQQ